MALEITDANFEETVLQSDKPVLVDFWAAVDANQEFAAKYGVRNIPTVLMFKGGEVVGRQVGVAPKNVYTEAIDGLL